MKVGSIVEVTTLTREANDGWKAKGTIESFDADGFVWVKLARTKTYYRAARSELELIAE